MCPSLSCPPPPPPTFRSVSDKLFVVHPAAPLDSGYLSVGGRYAHHTHPCQPATATTTISIAWHFCICPPLRPPSFPFSPLFNVQDANETCTNQPLDCLQSTYARGREQLQRHSEQMDRHAEARAESDRNLATARWLAERTPQEQSKYRERAHPSR